MNEVCQTCRFFNINRHKCQRHPPVRLPRKFSVEATAGNRVREEEIIFDWPAVEPTDWCGEWKPEEYNNGRRRR